MKVLHVIDALGLGGGAEHSLIAMLPEFQAQGVLGQVVCLDNREQGLYQDVAEMGIAYSVLPGRTLVSKAWTLRHKIRRDRPDVVHATLVRSSLVVRLACFRLPVKQVHSLVNTTYDPVRLAKRNVNPWKVRALRWVDSWSAKTVNGGFHALTEAVRAEAIDRIGIDPKDIWVTPRGRSSEMMGNRSGSRRAGSRDELGLASSDIVVLHVGRQDWLKAQDDIVRAFDLAAAQDERLRLWLVGRPGDATHLIEAAVRASRHRDRIVLFGHRTDIPDLMCAADMFVLFSHYEGFGGVLLEAMALECPIIASDAACFVEVLDHGTCGLLARRGQAVDLSEAILTFAGDPSIRAQFAARAHQRFNSKYELASVVDAMVDRYEQVIASNAGPRQD